MVDLKNIPTEQLIQELASRKGIKKIAVGKYQAYRLETRYEPGGNKQISADTVLLINPVYL